MTDRLAKLEKLLAADPNDAELCYMIALEHTKASRHDDAVRWLQRTVEMDPKQHYAYFQMGKAYAALGQPDAARAALQRGLDRANADGNHKAAGELGDLLASMSG